MDLFSEEQRITLLFLKNNSMVEMICTIEKVFDDRLNIVLPPYFMRYVECLKVGNRLTAKAFTKFGTVDFNTIIISSPLEENFTIELDYNSVKLTPGKDVPVIKALEILEIKAEPEPYKLKTFEISTEFVKVYSEHHFNIDEVCECSLSLPKDYGIINFKSIVTEIDSVYENEYTLTFTTMSEHDRQHLLYYMYMYTTNSD